MIIAAVFTLIGGLVSVVGAVRFASFYGRYAPFPPILVPYLAALGIFGIIGFVLGLAGGIVTLWRRHYPIALIGGILLVLAGLLNFAFTIIPNYGIGFYELTWTIYVLFLGVPCFVFSILALIFAINRRAEFG